MAAMRLDMEVISTYAGGWCLVSDNPYQPPGDASATL